MELEPKQRIQNLQSLVMRLAISTGEAISKSVEALRLRHKDLCLEVIQNDDYIDKLSVNLEREALEILKIKDLKDEELKLVSAFLLINVDLERIADHAVDIAENTLEIIEEPLLKPLIDIPKMKEICLEMLNASLNALINLDTSVAYSVIDKDESLDDMDKQIFRELLTYMMEDTRNIKRAFTLISISKYLERVGDHVTNIAERVIYLTTGELVKANRHK